MNKFLLIVLDGFGIGAMEDVALCRPQDLGANTAAHILQSCPDLHLPALQQLGLMNALGRQTPHMHFCAQANTGVALLEHEGGDTFMGHQEIMGSRPEPPLRMPFQQRIDAVAQALQQAGYHVDYRGEHPLHYLWVNHAVAIGDNLETDPGQVYNVSANLNAITFDEVKRLGHIVRQQVQVSRVIVFGGLVADSSAITDAAEVRHQHSTGINTIDINTIDINTIGINTPRSGLYHKGFQVAHLGYGIDHRVQVPARLHQVGVPTILIGKVADIVANPQGISHPGLVDSQEIMQLTRSYLQQPGPAFICVNIQETDLAGHAQDSERYIDRLQLVDQHLSALMSKMQADDYLLVMADHGNDPTIGHAQHTREKVPLLLWHPGLHGINLGERTTLADAGATVCALFGAAPPAHGHAFLPPEQLKEVS
ncbi:MAG: phosphopentomutase [Enterobacteriaceae bacterium]